jgi:hypothetical protein
VSSIDEIDASTFTLIYLSNYLYITKYKKAINLYQLVAVINKIPANQLKKLKNEVNKAILKKISKEDFRAFLLKAPIFSEEQIALLKEARQGFNQWGKSL